MAFIDDLDEALSEARADSLETMTDTCRITLAASGKGPFNQSTGSYDPPERILAYEGPCRFQIRADINSNVVEPVVAEREWSYQTSSLQLPVEASIKADRPDAVAECLTSRYDPSMPGRRFGILAGNHKSQARIRRLRVKEVTG